MDTLERHGLLCRSPGPADRRRVLVEITGNGQETLTRLLPDLHRAEVSWTEGLTSTQKAALLHGLGRLQQHLHTAQAKG